MVQIIRNKNNVYDATISTFVKVFSSAPTEALTGFRDSLKENTKEILQMLAEDDFPVEFFHDSGCKSTFWGPGDLESKISWLNTEISRRSGFEPNEEAWFK